MKLHERAAIDPSACDDSFFDSFKPRPAVFALFADSEGSAAPPYLGRTRDLRRRLKRLLQTPRQNSKLLNLRELARRIEFQYTGSDFDLQWLSYQLNRFYYPRQYCARMRLKPPALLKINLSNRFPRCYPSSRISNDGSSYYGPFQSRAAAERFSADFLDLFRIRRCVEDLAPDPSHPGCIYSQMKMCLAPCYCGCTDMEYQAELGRVSAFLQTKGRSLGQELESQRNEASEQLDFEQAARIHRKIEKLGEITRDWPDLLSDLRNVLALAITPGAQPHTVSFFLINPSGCYGPEALSFEENVSSPLPLDEQLGLLIQNLITRTQTPSGAPSWEHLSLLARWYYSSFRQGELVMLSSLDAIPHSRLIRICRKMVH